MNQAAQQERQLILTESLVNQIKSVLDNQKVLSETTEELKRQNLELKKALATREKENYSRKRRRSSIDVPVALKNRFKKVYAVLVSRNVVEGFRLDEKPSSAGNRAILETMKVELRKEHGGENCPWTDLEIEAQFQTYFKTRKERQMRVTQGQNERHKERSKHLRRINAKLERRMNGLKILRPSLKKESIKKMKAILVKDYQSSEESEYEEIFDNGEVTRKHTGYKVKRLPWERAKMRKIKKKLDEAHFGSLTAHAKGMYKKRKDGPPSTRPCQNGPDWAVRPQDHNEQ